MGRGAGKQAQQNAEAGAGQNQAYAGRASDVYNSLFPQLQNQAQNGLSMSDQAALNTASQQSLGGANAAVAGGGDLAAARTRNAGGYAPAVAESAREGMRQNSQNALGTVSKNIAAKQSAQQALQGLYGTSAQAGIGSLGASNQGVHEWNVADAQSAQNALGWAKFLEQAGMDAFGAAGGGGNDNG
jgi:hypothetical protein